MLWIILVIVVLLYAGFLTLLFATQRRIVFRPDPTRADLAAVGLNEQIT